MEHTKGPWDFAIFRDRFDIRNQATKKIVARVEKYALGSLPEMEANARLISAAPDLLDALHIAFEFAQGFDDEPDYHELQQIVRAAIRKAEGGH